MKRKNKSVRIRFTEDQYNKILEKARSRGYKSFSSYVRDLAMERNLALEKKIYSEIQEMKKLVNLYELKFNLK